MIQNLKNVKMWMKFIIKPLKGLHEKGKMLPSKTHETVILHHYNMKIMNHTDSEIYYCHSYFSSTNDWLIFILGFKIFFLRSRSTLGGWKHCSWHGSCWKVICDTTHVFKICDVDRVITWSHWDQEYKSSFWRWKSTTEHAEWETTFSEHLHSQLLPPTN